MSKKELFTLTYDPEPSGRFAYIQQGYWYAYAEPGYDAAGLTPEAAMAALIIQMAKALLDRE